jgi:metal-sulfur cluster biosynthetic enzyme
MDPEAPISITDPSMGIVKTEYIIVDSDSISVQFRPTAPYCPMGGLIGILIRHKIEEVFPGKRVSVTVLPGTHAQEAAVNSMINDNAKYASILQQLKQRKMI